MTLCDAGPLVALIDSEDKNHQACVAVLPILSSPLLTTWPCLTEAMYLVGRHGGYRDQEKLWQLVEAGTVAVHSTSDAEQRRMRTLMQKYQNVPMDMADASIVAAAEALGLSQVFTTDTDFYVYRIGDKKPFEVVPQLF